MYEFQRVCVVCLCVLGALAPTASDARADAIPVPDIDLIEIPAGPFIAGSDADERERAYLLDEAA
jgi:hypothetical protein